MGGRDSVEYEHEGEVEAWDLNQEKCVRAGGRPPGCSKGG